MATTPVPQEIGGVSSNDEERRSYAQHVLAGLLMLLLCSLPMVSYGQSVPEQPAAGSIGGTVLDVNGGVVLGAEVTLVASDGSTNRTVMSDDAGQFSFPGLAPGKFKCTVASTGFEPYASSEIVLSSGEKLILPEFRLSPAATTTDVQVSVTQLEIATEHRRFRSSSVSWAFSPTSTAATSGTRPRCPRGRSISLRRTR
jgi:hypothetical protein